MSKKLVFPKRGERIKKNASQRQNIPHQGEIWLAEFPPAKESRKPIRPVLIISDNIQNEYDEWITVVPITTEDIKNIEPFEVFIENTLETGLKEPSKICCNYLHTVNKKLRLMDKKRIGAASPEIMEKVKKALKIVLNLGD